MQGPERRQYTRHRISVPLTVRAASEGAELRSTVGDLSEGGLCFACSTPFETGASIEVSLPIADVRFTLIGTVTRSTPTDDGGYCVAIAFLHPEVSFRMKLAEQLLRIQELRKELARERGEDVTPEEAARQWVERYAAEFADLYA